MPLKRRGKGKEKVEAEKVVEEIQVNPHVAFYG